MSFFFNFFCWLSRICLRCETQHTTLQTAQFDEFDVITQSFKASFVSHRKRVRATPRDIHQLSTLTHTHTHIFGRHPSCLHYVVESKIVKKKDWQFPNSPLCRSVETFVELSTRLDGPLSYADDDDDVWFIFDTKSLWGALDDGDVFTNWFTLISSSSMSTWSLVEFIVHSHPILGLEGIYSKTNLSFFFCTYTIQPIITSWYRFAVSLTLFSLSISSLFRYILTSPHRHTPLYFSLQHFLHRILCLLWAALLLTSFVCLLRKRFFFLTLSISLFRWNSCCCASGERSALKFHCD